MKKQVRRNGFTLPEILVTVTVVAVLAAVVVPAVTQYVSKGDSPATQTDLTQIRNAITAYSADTRAYPGTFYDLESSPSGLTSWKGPYTGATLVGATGAGTFTSAGLNVKLGPAITSGSGYVTTPLVFVVTSATCQDLWNLDKTIDGGTGSSGQADVNSTSGSVQWGTACNATTNTGTSAATAPASAAAITLRLLTIGS
ncbi:MAG: Type secretion system protein [Gemmatimonadetes bacterium]|nr:Type secretion system protein [Gemmatimonadota bacterium]